MIKKILAQLGIYSKTQVLLAFEFGTILRDVCDEQKIIMTKQLMENIEVSLINELQTMTPQEFVKNQPVLILAILQEYIPSLKDVDNDA